jgi:hypothetical protein
MPELVSGGGAAKLRVGFCGRGNPSRMTNPRAIAYLSSVAAAVGLLSLLAVFVFWGAANSSDALPYFAVPGALFALSAALGFRAWQAGRSAARRPPS